MFRVLLLTLLSFAISAATAGEYDHSIGKYYVDFSGAVYCGPKSIESWNCGACKSHPGVNATSIVVKETDTHAFVAYVPERNQVVVSFAGTDALSIKNWISDLKLFHEPYPACDGCEAHIGFYDAYLSVAAEIDTVVARYVSAYPSASLGLTGHSLGAALAAHAAVDLTAKGFKIDELVTFGQPRFGNEAMVVYVESLVGTMFRMTHNLDPVPHLVPEPMGYRHTATEIFYRSDTEWHSCDGSGEDPKCSDRFKVALNLLDHLHYLGFDFITNYLGCKL